MPYQPPTKSSVSQHLHVSRYTLATRTLRSSKQPPTSSIAADTVSEDATVELMDLLREQKSIHLGSELQRYLRLRHILYFRSSWITFQFTLRRVLCRGVSRREFQRIVSPTKVRVSFAQNA